LNARNGKLSNHKKKKIEHFSSVKMPYLIGRSIWGVYQSGCFLNHNLVGRFFLPWPPFVHRKQTLKKM